MWYLLNARMWIATGIFAALVFSHFGAYRAGRAIVRAQWDTDIAQRAQAAAKAQEQARQREQDLVIAKNRAEERYAQEKRKAASAAASAADELRGLRDTLYALGNSSPKNPAAIPRVNGVAGLERELLGACAETLVAMAAEADRLEARLVGLQGYVKEVCLKQ